MLELGGCSGIVLERRKEPEGLKTVVGEEGKAGEAEGVAFC